MTSVEYVWTGDLYQEHACVLHTALCLELRVACKMALRCIDPAEDAKVSRTHISSRETCSSHGHQTLCKFAVLLVRFNM